MKATKQQRIQIIKNRMDKLTAIYLNLPKSGNVQATVNRIASIRQELTNQLKTA